MVCHAVIWEVCSKYVVKRPYILVGKYIQGFTGMYGVVRNLEGMEAVCEQYAQQYYIDAPTDERKMSVEMPTILLYHAFFQWTIDVQDNVLQWLHIYHKNYIIIDYSLAERTLEWGVSFIKYIREYPRRKALATFMHHGGLHGLLYRNGIQGYDSYRFPITQEVMIMHCCNLK